MCGRYYVEDEASKEMKKILEQLDRTVSNVKAKTGEVFPTNDAAILMAKGNKIEPDIFKWGFPHFVNKGVIINARSETVFEKKMFRESLVSRRCIIPASGFFEWNASKEKFYFTPRTSSIMYMAGIYNMFDNEARFVIVTTGSNPSIADVHDRMPLLLADDQIEGWILDGTQTQTILRQTPYLLDRKSEFEQQTLEL